MSAVCYKHHDKNVFVVHEFLGDHKKICICHQGCVKFKPGTDENCPTAEMSYQLSKITGLVLVMECKDYHESEDKR